MSEQVLIEWSGIKPEHSFGYEFSGLNPLDHWITKKAATEDKKNNARVYVANKQGSHEALAFYALKLHAEPTKNVEGRHKSKLETSKGSADFPCIKLEWLGVRKDLQTDNCQINHRLGEACLLDAIVTCAEVFDKIGGFAVLLEPANSKIEAFYSKYGFEPYGSGLARRMIMTAERVNNVRVELLAGAES